MLIPLNLLPPSDANPKLPPALAKISHDEIVLIELQGALEFDEPTPSDRDGQFIGILNIDEAGKKPTLTIGPHLLEGKVVSLPKPLAVLHRTSRPSVPQQDYSYDDGDDGDSADEPDNPSSKRRRLHQYPPNATDSQDDETQTQSTFSSKTTFAIKTSHTMETQLHNHYAETQPSHFVNPNRAPPPQSSSSSSSPLPLSHLSTTDRTVIVPPTWDIAAIIKKKIVFSKRPMPIIHKP
ncbi:hypothetical protein AX16_009127 [Volvariella volvacea WC 439]|nr:hypothetical protein AX16_009127 [Volvariella volvacea WC 439]